MKPLLPLDPRRSIATLTFHFQEEDFDADLDGVEGPERARFAKRMLAKHKAGPTPMADMVMAAEDLAQRQVERRAGVKEQGGYGTSYDDQGYLIVTYPIVTPQQVAKLRDLLDREGRSYEFAPYVETFGLTLLPHGYDGPVYGTGSSPRSDADLDDWLDEYATAPKRKRPTPKRPKSPAKRKANRH